MAIADLLQALERDAAAQARALVDDARARAAEIEAAALRAREASSARELAAARDACQAAADEQVFGAGQRARATLLTARAEMLERVRAALRAQLPAVLAERGDVADALATAAFRCAGDRPGTVRCAPAIAAHLRATAPATLRIEPAEDVATGVVIELDAGPTFVATLDALVDRDWPRLAGAIVALAGEEPLS